MLQVNNRTPFKCSLGLFPNEEGIDCAYGMAKATFDVQGPRVALAREQAPLLPSDQFWGDPAASSLKSAGDIGLSKPSTDILLQGHAYAPNGRALTSEVQLRVGPIEKRVRVFGNRVWEGGLFGLRISSPEPFERIPLQYELAFGGTDPKPKDQDKVDYEPRNPIGRGLVPKNSEVPRKGAPLPNLEHPRQLIQSPKDRPAPACFGPVCGHWEPRRSLAGTYDQTWLKKRAPFLPADFNPRFLQVAPPDLIATDYLKGGEPVEIAGATPDGPMRFELPRCTLEIRFHFDSQPHNFAPNLDTICFEPDQNRFTIIWRACHIVDKKPQRLKEVEFRCREFGPAEGGG